MAVIKDVIEIFILVRLKPRNENKKKIVRDSKKKFH